MSSVTQDGSEGGRYDGRGDCERVGNLGTRMDINSVTSANFLSADLNREMGNMLDNVEHGLGSLVDHLMDVSMNYCDGGRIWSHSGVGVWKDEFNVMTQMRGHKSALHYYRERHKDQGFFLADPTFQLILSLVTKIESIFHKHVDGGTCELDPRQKSMICQFMGTVKSLQVQN